MKEGQNYESLNKLQNTTGQASWKDGPTISDDFGNLVSAYVTSQKVGAEVLG